MPAWVELHVKGNGRAYVEVGMIGAVLTGVGADVMTPGTPTTPLRVVLRAGDTLDVIGDSAIGLMARMLDAKRYQLERKAAGAEDFYLDQLKPLEAPDGP